MLKAVVNATLVMRDHLIPSGTVLIEDGQKTYVCPSMRKKSTRKDFILAPGL